MVAIALDAMTSEAGASEVVKGGCDALKMHKDLSIYMVGDAKVLHRLVEKHASDPSLVERIKIVPSTDIIQHDDNPVTVLRNKPNSSTHTAVNLVKQHKAQACVSCANTGALMAISRCVLKRLHGVQRLSLAARYPTYEFSNDIILADVGASMDVEAVHIWQMAHLLAQYTISASGTPTVGLLSCGVEKGKGNRLVNQAVPMLESSRRFQYVGLVEPSDLFLRKADIVLCDGFVGNAILKTSEASAKYILDILKTALTSSPMARLLGGALRYYLNPYLFQIKPERRNGAMVLGVDGVVVKSHGNSEHEGVLSALSFAYNLVHDGVADRLKSVSLQYNDQVTVSV